MTCLQLLYTGSSSPCGALNPSIDMVNSELNASAALIPAVTLSCTWQRHYLIRHLRPEEPACSSWADGPCVDVLRVRPDQVTEGAFVRNFLITFNGSNLIERLDVWREAAVHTEDLLIY